MALKLVKTNVQVVSNLDDTGKDILKKHLRLSNPAYLSALRYSKWGKPKNIPEFLTYYTTLKSGALLFPLGLRIENILPKHYLTNMEVIDCRVSNKVTYPNFSLTLRPSQQEALEAYLSNPEDNIVTLPTGKGKSILALAVAHELKEKSLILVHKTDLIDNGFVRDILTCFPTMTKNDIGIFRGKSRTIGKQFTIATIQTLNRLSEEEIYEFSKNFGLVILDEAHHVGASTFDIVNAFSAKYRLALTATPERADGLTPLLHIFFGGFAFNKKLDTNGDEDILPVHVTLRTLPQVKYEPRFRTIMSSGRLKYIQDDIKGTIPLSKVTNRDVLPNISSLTSYGKIYSSSEFINRLAVDVAKEYNDGRSIVIFVSLKDQCTYIMEQLILRGLDPDDVQVYNGDTKDKEEALRLAENNKNFVTITTLKASTEGTNVKQWEVLFLATSIKDGKNVEQAVGRVRRRKEGKISCAKVYDYDLPKCHGLYGHTNSRLKRYSKLNFKVKLVSD